MYELATKLYFKFMLSDSELKNMIKVTEGEKFIPEYKENRMAAKIPKVVVIFVKNVCQLLNLKRDTLLLEAFSKRFSSYEMDCLAGQLSGL